MDKQLFSGRFLFMNVKAIEYFLYNIFPTEDEYPIENFNSLSKKL